MPPTILNLFSGAKTIATAAAGGVWIYVAIFAVGLSVGGAGAYKVMSWRMQAAEAAHAIEVVKAEAHTIEIERKAAEESGKAEAALQTARAQVRTVTQTIVKKVPLYVPAQADARCAIPRGFVLLHDAAAAGRALPDVPGAPAGADDGPAGVALSAVADTLAQNYGSYADVVAQLKTLQGWVRAQQAVRAP